MYLTEDEASPLHRSLADLPSQHLSPKAKDALLYFLKIVTELIEAEKSHASDYEKAVLVFYKAHALNIARGHPNEHLIDVLKELKKFKIVSFRRDREKNPNYLKKCDKWNTKIECTLCLAALMGLRGVLEAWQAVADEGPQIKSLKLH